MTDKKELWQEWTDRYIDVENPIPLFETGDELVVEFKEYGQNDRRILKRSREMEAMFREEGRRVIKDWETTDDTFDGLIYIMYWLDGGEIVPLYVGKAGKYGRDDESLSTNLEDLRSKSTRKFARWGDAHYYHIGNLSAIIFDHDKNQKQKYEKWANQLFQEGRRLRRETYFWSKAWQPEDIGPYQEENVPLEQLEGQIIDLTADLYPQQLLNKDGA